MNHFTAYIVVEMTGETKEDIGKLTINEFTEKTLQSCLDQRAVKYQEQRKLIIERAEELKAAIRRKHLLALEKMESSDNNMVPANSHDAMEIVDGTDIEKENIPIFKSSEGIWV